MENKCQCLHDYKDIPKWISSMIQLGYLWERERYPWKRRIGLVSMPCRSVAAAILALGLVRKDLERENANNFDGHFEAMCRARDIFLEGANDYESYVIDSNNKKWKFSNNLDGNGIYVTDARYKKIKKKDGRFIENLDMPCTSLITKDNAKYWRIEGCQVIETNKIDQKLSKNDYLVLPECEGTINETNLARTYSGLLLVGDGEGRETNYMREIYNVIFCRDGRQVSLGDLLTLHPQNGVARIAFCNYQKIDQQGNEHYLVVADGVSAFCKSLSHFKNCDVIGVYSRDEPVEKLSLLSEKLNEIGRYYEILDDYPPYKNMHPFITTRLMQRR